MADFYKECPDVTTKPLAARHFGCCSRRTALSRLTPGFASADPPSREPVAVKSPQVFRAADLSDPCGFQVQLEVLTNKATLTTFDRRNGVTVLHAAGALKVRLTNLSNGRTIDRNISGPTTLTVNADGSMTQKPQVPACGLSKWTWPQTYLAWRSQRGRRSRASVRKATSPSSASEAPLRMSAPRWPELRSRSPSTRARTSRGINLFCN